jgi:hypothetical protein
VSRAGRRATRRGVLAGAGALVGLLASARVFERVDGAPGGDFLDEVAERTWRYISSNWATDNRLPWSWRSASTEQGDYANPAEIGLYALTWVAAHAMGRPWSPAWSAVEADVGATLDQLRAWQTGSQPDPPDRQNAYRNSVFRQFYWINRTPPIVGGAAPGDNDRQTPSIDNAWLALCLIAIAERARAVGAPSLASKADAILGAMDFRIWYHPASHLFSWLAPDDPRYRKAGFAGEFSSENRLINFVARALGQLSAEEIQASLAALAQAPGTYDRGTADPADDVVVARVNRDGSYFTYAAPALLFDEMDTGYGRDTIDRATEAQIKYAGDVGYPVWGISDAYDVLDGPYLRLGAPPRGSGDPAQDPDRGLVVPHASALALVTRYSLAAEENLRQIATLFPQAYDQQYGFRDSVLVRPGDPGRGRVSSRFTCLAQTWTLLAIANLRTGVVWQSLWRNEGIRRARQETYPTTTRTLVPAVAKTGGLSSPPYAARSRRGRTPG